MPSGPAVGQPPTPDGAASLDELIRRLQALRAWTGMSYRELHRRVLHRRRSQGIAEEPAYATVYRCLQRGRSRLDIELVVDIVAVLTDDEVEAARWRQAYARLDGEAAATAYAMVFDALPEDVDDFTGRHDELATLLDRAAATNDVRVLAIEGMAGVGKTTLAVHAARRIVEGHRPPAVLSVNLCGHDPERAPVEPAAVLDGFLRLLGEPGPRIQALDLAARAARYRELLAEQTAVVLLDNAAREDQIEQLLPDQPSALTLVTSRHRVVRRPSALHVPLEVFSSDQALHLLRKRAGDAIDVNLKTATRIVEQIGRLPLAVALVASRIEASPGWTLDDHLDHLVERGESLRLDPGVELAFATSFEALPPSLRRMLRLLSLHPGRDCDTYAAAALAGIPLGDATRQLADLADASLVSTRIAGRYELHDLVRLYALSQARDEDAPSARRAALTRLLDHYRWAATTAMDTYAPAESTRRPPVPDSGTTVWPMSDRHTAASWLDTERANLVAVATHAAEHGWHAHVSDLSAVLAPYLHNTAQFDSAEILHGHASQVAEEAARGVALKDLASTHWQRGRRRQARSLLDEAIEIAETYNDQQTQSRALMNLAVVLRHLGRYSEAIDANLKAIELFRSLGDRAGEGRVMGNLGIIYTVLGRAGESMEHQQRALELVREQHDRGAEARNLENLSSLYSRLGRHHEARRAAISAVELAHRTGERVAESEALASLGVALAGLGDLESAAARQRGALDIAESVGSSQCMTNAHNALGSTLLSLGRLDDALGHHRAALTLAESLDDPLNQAKAHDGLARGYTLLGDHNRADAHGHAALDLYERLGVPDADNVAMYLNATPQAPKS